MGDLDIARSKNKVRIQTIAKKLGIKNQDLETYGPYIAKVDLKNLKRRGKLILVTSINPTPFGEGKTTVAIGLADGLQKIGKKSCLALREPSLGPVFGTKGGATGGGYAQVVPMENINLHFTGDLHAITTANNLISAIIENHVIQGNELNIDPDRIIWKRTMDLNARTLRKIRVGLGGEKNGPEREDAFTITAASEIMAIFCLAKNLQDLKRLVGNIVLAYTRDGKKVLGKDLKIENSVAILLKDAIKPNLVQTLEKTPAFIHGGPFANIAHGCNSIIATETALALSHYVVTEAGFGADLGAEKFIDIKARRFGLNVDTIVLVAAIRALRYNGGATKEEANKPNIELLKKGICNLERHMQNLTNIYDGKVVVALNKFTTDTKEEIDLIKELCKKYNVRFAICDAWANGGKGARDLAKAVVESVETNTSRIKYCYNLEDPVKEKIEKIVKKNYRAKNVVFSDQAEEFLNKLEDEYKNLPICLAKNQYSFSDNKTKLGAPIDFDFTITSIELRAGAGYIVAIAGNMLLMPGLSKNPAALNMTIDENNIIEGLF